MKNLQKRKILVFITLFAIPLFGLVAVAEKQRLSVEASHLIYNWSCLKLDGPYGSLEEADFIQPSLGEEYQTTGDEKRGGSYWQYNLFHTIFPTEQAKSASFIGLYFPNGSFYKVDWHFEFEQPNEAREEKLRCTPYREIKDRKFIAVSMISGRKLLTYDDYGERVWHPATVFGTNFGILYWLGFTAIYWGVFYRYFLVPSQKQCFDDAKDLVGLNINLRNVIGFIIPVMLTIGFLLLSFNEALAKPSATRSFEMLRARIAMALGAAFLTVVVQQLIAPFVTALMLFSGFMAYMAGLPIDLSRLQLAIIELFGILPEEIIDILGVSKSTVAFVFAFFAPAISILALFKSLSQDRL